ncbi:hypothetical protein KM043_003488 [Ampulex compressa]|nr:hypothetical protein KM043_003488 [Ampulex compressa]
MSLNLTFQLSPEYLSFLQQYTHTQPQAYTATTSVPPQRRPLPAYAKQQQALQQAYYNFRKPTVVPPRPRTQLHPQAEAQAEAIAQNQANAEIQNRIEALQSARLSPSSSSTYQVANPLVRSLSLIPNATCLCSYELREISSQARLPSYLLKHSAIILPQESHNLHPQHSQSSQLIITRTFQVPSYQHPKLGTFEQELLQLVSANQAQEFKLLPTQPKGSASPYSQQLVSYDTQYAKPSPAPSHLPQQYHIETTPERYQQQYQPVQHQPQYQKPFRPSPQYEYVEDPQVKAAEAEASARAQAQANAQALAFQKVAQAAHHKHQADALEQIRIVNERYRQQSALEQIQQGSQVSDAGRAHREEQQHPKDPEQAYRARVKAQISAQVAEERRIQEATEYKAHADAIKKLQAQQQAHLKAQEDAHNYALNFERIQLRAQAQAQALAQAQAEALYKVHMQARAKANSEAQALARAQAEARKADPEHTPVVQYLLPNSSPLPSPNSYFTNDQANKYQASGSSYVPRSVAKPEDQQKLKIPAQGSVYVSPSGILKKSPVKSLTIEEIIEQDQVGDPQVVRIPSPKGHLLTQEDLSALINAGYTVTPVPQAKPTQQPYSLENSSVGYYAKKQKVSRPDYLAYEDAVQRPRRPIRKNGPILKQEEGEASEKVTYLVPLEPAFGTRQPPLRRHE